MPEQFWRIIMMYHADGGRPCEFTWARGRLFDHAMATLLHELCQQDGQAQVTKVLVRGRQEAVILRLQPNISPTSYSLRKHVHQSTLASLA